MFAVVGSVSWMFWMFWFMMLPAGLVNCVLVWVWIVLGWFWFTGYSLRFAGVPFLFDCRWFIC